MYSTRFGRPRTTNALLPYICQENMSNAQLFKELEYLDDNSIRKRVDKHMLVINHFGTGWKKEYLTVIKLFNQISGHNDQVIKILLKIL